MANGDRQKIIKVAAELMKLGGDGAHEEIKRCSNQAIGWYIGGNAWCACTVSVIFWKAGLGHLVYRSAQVYEMARGDITEQDKSVDRDLGKYGLYKANNFNNPNMNLYKSLRPGDLVVFRRNKSHIGIFVKFDPDTGIFTTIEGNHSRTYGNNWEDVRISSNSSSRFASLSGFIIPKFEDNSGTLTDSDGTTIIVPGIDVKPRIVNTNTELKETDINTSNKIWSFYTNTLYRNTSQSTSVPIGLNPVKNTLGTDTSNLRDMSVMKNNYLGYVIGRSLEMWDSPLNYNFDIIQNYSDISSSTRPLIFCQNGKWYVSNEPSDNESAYSYKEYNDYSTIETPFNSYFGNIGDDQKVNWNNVDTPEKLLMHIVRSNSKYNYEPAFVLQDENDVTKGFKRSGPLRINTKNDNCDAKTGAIAVWVYNSISSNNRGMIMGFVEKVKSNNRILVSWSASDSFFFSSWLNPYALANNTNRLSNVTGIDTRNRMNNSGIYFWGYIYPPAGAEILENNYFLTTGSAVMNWTTERIWVV